MGGQGWFCETGKPATNRRTCRRPPNRRRCRSRHRQARRRVSRRCLNRAGAGQSGHEPQDVEGIDRIGIAVAVTVSSEEAWRVAFGWAWRGRGSRCHRRRGGWRPGRRCSIGGEAAVGVGVHEDVDVGVGVGMGGGADVGVGVVSASVSASVSRWRDGWGRRRGGRGDWGDTTGGAGRLRQRMSM